MRVVLFAWCATSAVYIDALCLVGAAPRLVVTGRGTSAAAVLADACKPIGVPVMHCDDVRDDAFFQLVAEAEPELLLVTGCPQRLPARLLSLPTLGAVNLHPSLLPHYRGREPLFWALLRGETHVGMSAHQMTQELDAGPVLLQRPVEVPPRATSATLARDVERAGASLVVELIARARAGALGPVVTNDAAGTAFPRLRPEHGLVDWSRSAVEIDRLVRAATGELEAYAFVHGMRVVLLVTQPIESDASRAPGTVIAITDAAVVIAAGHGAVACERFVFLRRVRSGRELALDLAIAVGDRFSANPAF